MSLGSVRQSERVGMQGGGGVDVRCVGAARVPTHTQPTRKTRAHCVCVCVCVWAQIERTTTSSSRAAGMIHSLRRYVMRWAITRGVRVCGLGGDVGRTCVFVKFFFLACSSPSHAHPRYVPQHKGFIVGLTSLSEMSGRTNYSDVTQVHKLKVCAECMHVCECVRVGVLVCLCERVLGCV
jgi:hypothetical protein